MARHTAGTGTQYAWHSVIIAATRLGRPFSSLPPLTFPRRRPLKVTQAANDRAPPPSPDLLECLPLTVLRNNVTHQPSSIKTHLTRQRQPFRPRQGPAAAV